MFRGICTQEVHDAIMNINLKKSTIGIPQLCIKLACNHISEALTLIFNPTDPSNFRPISTLSQVIEKHDVLFQF